jgi:hypothetical protein
MMLRPKPLGPPSDPHVRSVLLDGLGAAPDPRALNGESWTLAVTGEIDRRHLACLALAFVDSHGVSTTSQVHRSIRRAAFAEAAAAASVVAGAAPALDALAAAGIAFVGVKGVALAGCYGPATPRYMGDLDILVSPDDFQAAYDSLVAEGGRTYFNTPRGSTAVCPSVNVTNDTGLQVDLHRALAPWRWARGLTFDRLRAASTAVEVGDRLVPVTGVVHALLVAASAIVSDCATLYEKSLPWRDVALLVRAVESQQRTDELVEEATATGTAWMLKLVLEALPDPIRPALTDRLASPSRLQRAELAIALDPRVAGKQWSWMLFRWPLRRLVAFERAMFWPSRSSLHAHGEVSRTMYLKALVHELRSN